MGLPHLLDLKPERKITIEVRILSIAKKILWLMYKRVQRKPTWVCSEDPQGPRAAFVSLHGTPGHQVWSILFLSHIQFP